VPYLKVFMEYVSVSAIVCIAVVIFRLFVYEGHTIYFGRLVEMLNRSLVPSILQQERRKACAYEALQ
jgi:hypothetical protein